MAYSNGSPASLTALMNDLKAFAIASGGFSDTGSGYTASSYTYFSLTKGSVKFNFSYKDAGGGGDVLANTSTAWAGSGLLTAQTGAHSANARALFGLTPLEYWFFSDGVCVHAVVEISADCYAHLSFGVLEKAGSYTGGEYVCANYWASSDWTSSSNNRVFDFYVAGASYPNHIRLSYNAKTIALMGVYSDTSLNFAMNMWAGGGHALDGASGLTDGELWKCQPNNYNGRSVLIPIEMFIANVPGSFTSFNGWIPLGRVSNAAMINIKNLSAQDTVNTDWMVFPLCMKNPVTALTVASGQVNTYDLGLAYKK